MKSSRLIAVGDEVRSLTGRKETGTVVEVRMWKVRVLFPIRKFAWVPLSGCEKVERTKAS